MLPLGALRGTPLCACSLPCGTHWADVGEGPAPEGARSPHGGCCCAGGEYDLKLGTSERGERTPAAQLALPPFHHLLLVFGGPEGLERCLANDALGGWHADPAELFHRYLNTCFDQGSRCGGVLVVGWMTVNHGNYVCCSEITFCNEGGTGLSVNGAASLLRLINADKT